MSIARGPLSPSRVDRFALPVVIALLAVAITALIAAAAASSRVTGAYEARDQDIAAATSSFVESFLRSRQAQDADWIAHNVDALAAGHAQELAERISSSYLSTAPSYVLAAVVTAPDGTIAVAASRSASALNPADVREMIASTGLSAAGRARPVIGGFVRGPRPSDHWYVRALPVSGTPGLYGAWVTVADVDASPLGAYFSRFSQARSVVPIIVDDRGHAVIGPRDSSGHAPAAYRDANSTVTRHVSDSTWTIVMPRTATGGWVHTALLYLLAGAIVLLGFIYWIQEAARKVLRREATDSTRRLEALFEFANVMLRAGNPQEIAEHLAGAVRATARLDGVRVRIAADRDPEGTLSGAAPAHAHVYRIALTGHNQPAGELLGYRADARISDEQRRIIRTMAAIAGAAVDTLVALDRERTTAEELQRIDELRTNLLSTVAHELRSPLTAIKGVLSLLSFQGDLSDKQREYVDVATQRTDALVDLIQDLFTCSLMESGQLSIKPERLPATELLENALGALARVQPDDVYLSATPNLHMTVDPMRFDQIVNNLVTNAFRHGEAPVEVVIRPYAQGSCVTVTDSGPGIPRAERDRIFSKFYQSDSGNARLVDGAGLGLALVHGLVTLHGGHITVDAARFDGKGARFMLFFPDVAPANTPIEHVA